MSRKNASAEKLLSYTRNHWQVESFHWLLDMNYDEDESRVRNKNSQECLNIIRKYAISILKKYIENNPVKKSFKCEYEEMYDELAIFRKCIRILLPYSDVRIWQL